MITKSFSINAIFAMTVALFVSTNINASKNTLKKRIFFQKFYIVKTTAQKLLKIEFKTTKIKRIFFKSISKSLSVNFVEIFLPKYANVQFVQHIIVRTAYFSKRMSRLQYFPILNHHVLFV